MAISITRRDWPNSYMESKEEIFTIGAIALSYGQLENTFRQLFSTITGMDELQIAALFQRIPNNIRQDILHELMGQGDLSDDAKKCVRDFTGGFKACADNRNDIMHAHLGYTITGSSKHGVVLHKFSKSGNKLTCSPSLQELKQIADSMRAYAAFGARINENARASPFPSLDRPPPPSELNWTVPEHALDILYPR